MLPTLFNAICLIVLGLAGFTQWESLNSEGRAPDMLMPVFFGGAFLICLGFSRQHYRHGLYGGLIIAMLGVVSALLRIYSYEKFLSINQPRTQIIAVMAVICVLQLLVSWKKVQQDRALPPPV